MDSDSCDLTYEFEYKASKLAISIVVVRRNVCCNVKSLRGPDKAIPVIDREGP
jgi:hypothetical protein